MKNIDMGSVKKYIVDNPDTIIGSGVSRNVYRPDHEPKVVYKVEKKDSFSFQNVKEYLICDELQYTAVYSMFAKILAISEDGGIVVQEYARDVTDEEYERWLDGKCPWFVTDIKKDNVGVINGKVVIRDYGSSILTKNFRNISIRNRVYE